MALVLGQLRGLELALAIERLESTVVVGVIAEKAQNLGRIDGVGLHRVEVALVVELGQLQQVLDAPDGGVVLGLGRTTPVDRLHGADEGERDSAEDEFGLLLVDKLVRQVLEKPAPDEVLGQKTQTNVLRCIRRTLFIPLEVAGHLAGGPQIPLLEERLVRRNSDRKQRRHGHDRSTHFGFSLRAAVVPPTKWSVRGSL